MAPLPYIVQFDALGLVLRNGVLFFSMLFLVLLFALLDGDAKQGTSANNTESECPDVPSHVYGLKLTHPLAISVGAGEFVTEPRLGQTTCNESTDGAVQLRELLITTSADTLDDSTDSPAQKSNVADRPEDSIEYPEANGLFARTLAQDTRANTHKGRSAKCIPSTEPSKPLTISPLEEPLVSAEWALLRHTLEQGTLP
jgi:hypothetical protein